MKLKNFPFQLIDLSQPISSSSPTWHGGCGFSHEIVTDYHDLDSEVKFRVQKFKLNAGIGTHMDAPAHCCSGAKTVEQFSLQELLFPCIVMDVSRQAKENYQISLEDIQRFESAHAPTFTNSFVLFHTGWGRYWAQPEKYRADMRFPSIAKSAVEYLLQKNIAGLGIDTLSPDTPESGFPVHQLIFGAGKIILENVTNAHLLPATGGYLLVAAMLVAQATEAPVRLIGLY